MLNWVEIDAAAIRHNLACFRRRLASGAVLAPVVKSNAYGHGMLEVAAIARRAGASWLCVNSVDEAVGLREAGHRERILVMGYVPLDRLDAVVTHDLRPVVYNDETVARLETLAAAAGRPVEVHLKLETGTHRQGLLEEDALRLAAVVRDASHLRLEGATTHFANIEDTTDHAFAERQIERFSAVLERLRAAGHDVAVRHAACSAATLLFTRTHLDLARVGISTYGIWPSRETLVSCRDRGKPALELRPALSWKTRVAQVKRVPDGSYIGYGCTFRTTRPSTIAVLPVGYNEGYDRRLSGRAHVLVRGRRAPVVGRVCMNIMMIDVTDVPGVKLEDEVVLLGRQRDERVEAERLAGWLDTIAYEVLARINPRLPRVVIDDETPVSGAPGR